MNKKLEAFRQTIHRHPELSNEEQETAKRVIDMLREFQPDEIMHPVGGTGIIAIYDSGKEGPNLMFRAELDALPIEEKSDVSYRSQTENVSHMCGHDGHMTILLGLAEKLQQQPPAKGKIFLLFQPGEENGTGAKAMLNDENINFPEIDMIFALHNLPGYPLHQVVFKKGAFTPHVISVILRLEGKTSHAAEPESGINPALAISKILDFCDRYDNKDMDDSEFFLITPVHLNMGEVAYGISAGYAEIHLTLRSWNQNILNKKSSKLMYVIEDICKEQGIKLHTEWTHEFFSNLNDEEAVDIIKRAAEQAGLETFEKKMPFKWGEDFGLFTQKFKGAMFGLGSGENTPALHNPDYDFPDALLESGSLIFYNIIKDILK